MFTPVGAVSVSVSELVSVSALVSGAASLSVWVLGGGSNVSVSVRVGVRVEL